MRWDCTNADKQFYLYCLIELAQCQTKTNKNTRRYLRVIRAKSDSERIRTAIVRTGILYSIH